MQRLTLDIVGPKGAIAHEEELESVVFRRREEVFEPGSEVAVQPGHAPLLAQAQPCELRCRRDNEVVRYAVGDCLIEVWENHVTVALT